MDINQNDQIELKLRKIKNAIYKQIDDKVISKRFKFNMIDLLSEIWNMKHEIKLEIFLV